jgi:hypothetical protein
MVDYDTNNMTLRDILDNTTPDEGESISAIHISTAWIDISSSLRVTE